MLHLLIFEWWNLLFYSKIATLNFKAKLAPSTHYFTAPKKAVRISKRPYILALWDGSIISF
jgi:hypothetical protein